MKQNIQKQLEQMFHVSYFDNAYDKNPKERELVYSSFRKKFSLFIEKPTKESVGLWSPARFIEGSTRSKSNVLSVCAIVLDFDSGVDWTDFIADWKSKGIAFWVHNTYSHSSDKPKWRAIFPLLSPCPNEQWRGVWETAAGVLGHGACDVSASDSSRMYYLPSRPLNSTKADWEFIPFDGDFVDWQDFIPTKHEEVVPAEVRSVGGGNGRPGDDFEGKASWSDILAGWDYIRTVGDLEYYTRPGKGRKETSATVGYRAELGGERFYCFSSNAGVPANKYLTKFGLYTHLQHGGDFAKATKELAAKGYGGAVARLSKSIADDLISPQELNEALDMETAFTDFGNARRFVADWGEDLRYVVESKSWAKWTGKRWEIGDIASASVQALAIKSAQEFMKSSFTYTDSAVQKNVFEWGQKSVNLAKLKSCVEMAASMLAVSVNDFDKHPNLLNTQDGIVNVDTGELMPHDKTKLMCQITNCGYNAMGGSPSIFAQFLGKIVPDNDTRLFLLKWLGYGFTGYTHDQTFLFSYGASGANGKSTLFNLIEWMAGSYATTMDQSAIMSNKGFATNTYELAKLVSKRWVTVAEIGDGRFNEQLLKVLTGGDMMTARQVYEKAVEFQPVLKLAMFGNHKPIISQEASTWRRVRLIDFNVTIPEEERDAKLGEKLRGEASIILAYLIGAYRMSKEQGMKPSALMTNDAEEYKEENNILQLFFDEKLRFSSVATVMVSSMHKEYLEWARERNATLYNPTSFGRIIATPLLQRGCSKRRTNEGIRWAGVEIGGI
jgi:P4 family phage/plasmid primase-like protien